MSVKQCDRRGCDNIMCDRYSVEHGYICDGCFSELSAKYGEDINDFMSFSVKPILGGVEFWKEIIEREFKKD
jgi:hypothetical protein